MEYKVEVVPLDQIFSDDIFNCRGRIHPMDVVDLARDIQENGLDIPIVIRPYDKHPPQKYQIVAGHRRYMAFRVNKSTEIPAQVRNDLDDFTAAGLNLRENLTRSQLNIKQEAYGIKRFVVAGWRDFDIAKFIHQSRGWVQVRMMLLRLPDAIQNEAAAGMITQDQIRKLDGRKEEDQFALVRKIKEAKFRGEKIELPKERIKDLNKIPGKSLDRNEIFEMLEHVFKNVGMGLATRCLAYAAGEISFNDVCDDIKAECVKLGKLYCGPQPSGGSTTATQETPKETPATITEAVAS